MSARSIGGLLLAVLIAEAAAVNVVAGPACDLVEMQRLYRDGGAGPAQVTDCVDRCLPFLDPQSEPGEAPSPGLCVETEVRCLVLGFFGIECGERDCQAELRDAGKQYSLGRFESAERSLMRCLDIEKRDHRTRPLHPNYVAARALESKIHVARDDPEAALRSVQRLTCVDPGYSAELFDPPLFRQLLQQAQSDLHVPRTIEEAAELCAAPTPLPDLGIWMALPRDGARHPPGTPLTVEATVFNGGDAETGPFLVRVLVDGEEVAVQGPLAGLPPGRPLPVTLSVVSPALDVQGPHDIELVVYGTAMQPERLELNNADKATIEVGSSERQAELELRVGWPAESEVLRVGEPLHTAVAVANFGEDAGEPFHLEYTFDGGGIGVEGPFDPLAPGKLRIVEHIGPVVATAGEHTLLVRLLTAETSVAEGNHADSVTFSAADWPLDDRPDPLVRILWPRDGDELPAGEAVRAWLLIANAGERAAEDVQLDLWSDNRRVHEERVDLSPWRPIVRDVVIDGLQTGGHLLELETVPVEDEQVLWNNRSRARIEVVDGPDVPLLDLAIRIGWPIDSTNVPPNEPLQATAIVTNVGRESIESYRLEFSVRGGRTVSSGPHGPLAPGVSEVFSEGWPALSPGVHEINVRVVAAEDTEPKNDTDVVRFETLWPPGEAADLAVELVWPEGDLPMKAGSALPIVALVTNSGTEEAGAFDVFLTYPGADGEPEEFPNGLRIGESVALQGLVEGGLPVGRHEIQVEARMRAEREISTLNNTDSAAVEVLRMPQPRPDLAVRLGWPIENEALPADQPFWVSALVANVGDGDSEFLLRFYDGSEPLPVVDEQSGEAVRSVRGRSGKGQLARFTLETDRGLSLGKHLLQARVEPLDAEAPRDNNEDYVRIETWEDPERSPPPRADLEICDVEVITLQSRCLAPLESNPPAGEELCVRIAIPNPGGAAIRAQPIVVRARIQEGDGFRTRLLGQDEVDVAAGREQLIFDVPWDDPVDGQHVIEVDLSPPGEPSSGVFSKLVEIGSGYPATETVIEGHPGPRCAPAAAAGRIFFTGESRDPSTGIVAGCGAVEVRKRGPAWRDDTDETPDRPLWVVADPWGRYNLETGPPPAKLRRTDVHRPRGEILTVSDPRRRKIERSFLGCPLPQRSPRDLIVTDEDIFFYEPDGDVTCARPLSRVPQPGETIGVGARVHYRGSGEPPQDSSLSFTEWAPVPDATLNEVSVAKVAPLRFDDNSGYADVCVPWRIESTGSALIQTAVDTELQQDTSNDVAQRQIAVGSACSIDLSPRAIDLGVGDSAEMTVSGGFFHAGETRLDLLPFGDSVEPVGLSHESAVASTDGRMFFGTMKLRTDGTTTPGEYTLAVAETADACPSAVVPVRVTVPRYVWEIGVEGGFFLPDSALSGKGSSFSEAEPFLGLRAARKIATRWRALLAVGFSEINTDLPAEDVQDAATLVLRAGVERSLHRWHGTAGAIPRQWFVSLGAGWFDFDLELAEDATEEFLSFGFGQRIALDRRTRLRWELRADQTLDDGTFGDRLLNMEIAFGLAWRVGKRE